MSNYSIHFSPTGGTKKVADILAKALWEDYREIDLCRVCIFCVFIDIKVVIPI